MTCQISQRSIPPQAPRTEKRPDGLRLLDGTGALAPQLPPSALKTAARLPFPPGNVAVSPGGRVFFTFHPDGNPSTTKLAEWVADPAHPNGGQIVPFPSAEYQARLRTVQGVRVDRQNRLWVLDHGKYGVNPPRLAAFDLASGNETFSHTFEGLKFRGGSMLNDFQVAPDGKTVFIADTSPLAPHAAPAVVVVDLSNPRDVKVARRLEGHPSTANGPYDVYMPGPGGEPLRRVKGPLGLRLKFGVDSIGLSPNGKTLYFAALNSGQLFAVPTEALKSSHAEAQVRKVADIPVSDGITVGMDKAGREKVFVTGVETAALYAVDTQTGKLEKVVQDPARLHWPDGIGWGPGGELWATGSVLDAFIDDFAPRAKELERHQHLFSIFRVKPPGEFEAPPGH